MQRYYDIAKKPILAGSFSCQSIDSGLKVNQDSCIKIVSTQQKRADFFEWYAKNCLKTKYTIGYHWFKLVDGNYNFGLVNNEDEPYNILVDRMEEINSMIYNLHDN